MVEGLPMAEVAALVGEPGRAAMLELMMDGRAHTAGELGTAAGVTAPTASGHLAKLLDRRLVEVTAQGRHRYYRLASVEVARMLESIMVVTGVPGLRANATLRIPTELCEARTCYDHLAGRLGVAIADAMMCGNSIPNSNDLAELSERGLALLAVLGIEADSFCGRGRRLLCRPCLDWSERRPHLSGALGATLLLRLIDVGWIERAGRRAVRITTLGAEELRNHVSYRLK